MPAVLDAFHDACPGCQAPKVKRSALCRKCRDAERRRHPGPGRKTDWVKALRAQRARAVRVYEGQERLRRIRHWTPWSTTTSSHEAYEHTAEQVAFLRAMDRLRARLHRYPTWAEVLAEAVHCGYRKGERLSG